MANRPGTGLEPACHRLGAAPHSRWNSGIETKTAGKRPELIPAEQERGDVPMTYADSTERAALIGGLRDLADYLESSPGVPAPIYTTFYAFPPNGDLAEMRAEIDAIAAHLGIPAHLTDGGHYFAARSFGPVEYRAVAIPRTSSSTEESE
ncbi:MAG: hypothetical protein ACRDN0_02540 [Trebonia sp.]